MSTTQRRNAPRNPPASDQEWSQTSALSKHQHQPNPLFDISLAFEIAISGNRAGYCLQTGSDQITDERVTGHRYARLLPPGHWRTIAHNFTRWHCSHSNRACQWTETALRNQISLHGVFWHEPQKNIRVSMVIVSQFEKLSSEFYQSSQVCIWPDDSDRQRRMQQCFDYSHVNKVTFKHFVSRAVDIF